MHRTARPLFLFLAVLALISALVIPFGGLAQNVVQVPCAAVPSGIVSWWRGEGDASDTVGPNNGALNGASANAIGKVGQAFSFNGAGDFVDIPDSPSLDSTSSIISVEGWINSLVPSTDRGYIFARRDPYVTESFSVHIDPQARIGVVLRTTSSPDEHGSFFVSAPGIIQFGQWQHLAITLDTNTGLLKAYLNAQLTPLAALEGPSGFSGPMVNADHTFIGQRQSQTDPGGTEGATGAAYFKGLIDELAIYSTELTQSEIAQIYFADTFGKCIPQPTPTPTPTVTPTPTPTPTPVTVVRTPPYDFFNGCNNRGGQAIGAFSHTSSITTSDPIRGKVNVDVLAQGFGAWAVGRAGVGINYDAASTGSVKVKVVVRVSGSDVLRSNAIRILRLTLKVGTAFVESDTFVLVSPPVDGISTSRFRNEWITPQDGLPVIGLIYGKDHVYNPPEEFSVERTTSVVRGRRYSICGGVRARVGASTLIPLALTTARANYSVDVVRIEVSPLQ